MVIALFSNRMDPKTELVRQVMPSQENMLSEKHEFSHQRTGAWTGCEQTFPPAVA